MEDSHDFGWGQQKVPMRYFYAKWRKADLTGQKQIKLIISEGLMHTKFKILVLLIKVSNVSEIKTNPHLANSFKNPPAPTKPIMKLMATCTSMSVVSVSLTGKNSPMH